MGYTLHRKRNKQNKKGGEFKHDLEKNYLFKYHLEVYSKISPFLNINEKRWLAKLI